MNLKLTKEEREMMENECDERMTNLITKFVLRCNVWAFIFSRVRRVPKWIAPSIMGVYYDPHMGLTMFYQPYLVANTSDEVLMKIIEHEGLHLVLKHLSRGMRILGTFPKKEQGKYLEIMQNATDCAVNEAASYAYHDESFTINHSEWALMYPTLFSLPKGKSFEFYFWRLIEKQCTHSQGGSGSPQKDQGGGASGKEGADKSGPESGGGGGSQSEMGDNDQENGQSGADGSQAVQIPQPSDGGGIDDHSQWNQTGGGQGSDPNIMAQRVEQAIQDLVRESIKQFEKRRGELPKNLKELIEDCLSNPPLPYYQIIRKWVRGARLAKDRWSSTRINRKRAFTFFLPQDQMILPYPGRVRDYSFHIVILIDTSGSMTRDEILEALKGIKDFIENDKDCRVTVLEVDTKVNTEYECKRLKDINFEVKGRGGTTLFPGLKRAKELNCDVCLCFTDGYCEPINKIQRNLLPRRIIWAITEGGISTEVDRTGPVLFIPKKY